MASTVKQSGHMHLLAVVAILVAVLALGLFHQPYYPATWLDEGFVLQGAMNLVRYGKYAMKSVEGFRILDQPLIANGPGVVLPISLAFRFLGIGLVQARMVMVVYMVLAAWAFLMLGRRLGGWATALVSLLLLLGLPAKGFLYLGRQALGDVPALAYFLAGYLFWLVSLRQEGLVHAACAGVLWGAAIITKNQYGLLLPALALVAVIERLHVRQIGPKKVATAFLVALGCLGIWQAVQLALVGWESYGAHLSAVRASARVTVFAFRAMRIPGSAYYLLRSGIVPVVAPGLLYAGWGCWKRERRCASVVLLAAFCAVWLLWYVVASVGWHRYAFAAYAVGCLLSGELIVRTMNVLRGRPRRSGRGWMARMGSCAAILLVIGGLTAAGYGLVGQVRAILARPDVSAHEFARYLRENVEPGAVVESWEWQLDVLADLRYHHPTNDWVDAKTAVLQFGDEEPRKSYCLLAYGPHYLIDGPFSKWTALYARELSEGCCQRIYSAGRYDLYEVVAAASKG